MARCYKQKNAYRALVEDARDFITTLNKLNLDLEIIQKKLNDLLAAKRGNFPRFYFLSNEDLLEIIGQALNPDAINKHIQYLWRNRQDWDRDHHSRQEPKRAHDCDGPRRGWWGSSYPRVVCKLTTYPHNSSWVLDEKLDWGILSLPHARILPIRDQCTVYGSKDKAWQRQDYKLNWCWPGLDPAYVEPDRMDVEREGCPSTVLTWDCVGQQQSS